MSDSILTLRLATIPTRGRDEETESARDENDAIIRQEEATREQFDETVTVFIDGYEVVLPKAVPVTDSQGNRLRGPDGELIPRNSTIYDAAMQLVDQGVWTRSELDRRIPVLCHQPHLNPIGVCRMCSVWIVHSKRGAPRTERKLLPACQHLVSDDMRVTTRAGREGLAENAEDKLRSHTLTRAGQRAIDGGQPWTEKDEAAASTAFDQDWAKFLPQVEEWTDRIRACQSVLAELLVADHVKDETAPGRYVNELEEVARVVEVASVRESFARAPELASRNAPASADRRSRRVALPVTLPYSSRTVQVDHDRCILCDRCVRSCSDVKPFRVIGHTGKGYDTRVSFDLDDLMGESSCVQCGECMTACPTGALSVRRRVQPRAWEDSPESIPTDATIAFARSDPKKGGFLTADEMREVVLRYVRPGETTEREVWPFATIPFAYLKWNEGAVRRWVIPPGETQELCREGEYGSTAFLTDGSGNCEVYGKPAEPPAKTGLFSRLFRSRAETAARERGPLIRKVPGTELVQGEIACLSHSRRTASVVAVADPHEPMTVYETTRNLLDMMQRADSIRGEIARLYAFRAAEACVRNGQLFGAYRNADGDDERTKQTKAKKRAGVIQLLTKGGLTLLRLDAGRTIVREGDTARGGESFFYIIRSGFIQVTRRVGGVEQVLSTLGAGEHFGEVALWSDAPVRSASASTLDPAEVVLVPREKFLRMCAEFPEVEAQLRETAQQRRNTPPVSSAVLNEYVGQGLYQAQRLLALDLVKCTRCDECTKACADSHPEEQGDGHARLLRDGLRFGDFLVATSCRSCHTPYCMEGCPVDAIHRRGTQLEVVIEDHCIGCGLCERNCPYGSIHMVPNPKPNLAALAFPHGNPNLTAARKAVNCDLCGGDPFCVSACPHDAAIRIDGPSLLQLVRKRGDDGN